MIIDELVRKPSSWLSDSSSTGIVISSRVRLARNIRNFAFPGWAKEEDRINLCERLRNAFEELNVLKGQKYFSMADLVPVDKDVLRERHLISNELADAGPGSALIVAADERVAVMINEEDHLRLQAITPGMHLKNVFERVDTVDTALEAVFDYEYSRELGYLTACPSNVGTGLRASVMMHLVGLRLTNEIDQVIKGLNKMGYAVRGLLGEGSEAFGNMFQVSNQSTLGASEQDIVNNMIEMVNKVASHEKNARSRLLEDREVYVYDRIWRALGALTHARIISSQEAIDQLSYLRLGIELDIVKNVESSRINDIILLTQPGHLQKIASKVLKPQERDELRADIVRQKLGEAIVVSDS